MVKGLCLAVLVGCLVMSAFGVVSSADERGESGVLVLLLGEEGSGWRNLWPDSICCDEPLSRAEFRASRDIFFHGRGDTLFLLADRADILQSFFSDQCHWLLRPLSPQEQRRKREVRRHRAEWPMADRYTVPGSVRLVLFFDPASGHSADSALVRTLAPATRGELAAFLRRETLRRSQAFARTKNLRWNFLLPHLLWAYFDEVFLLIPGDDGNRYGLFRIQ